MGWTVRVGSHVLAEETMTAGQHAAVWLVVAADLPHDEGEIGPTHCPVCRNALGVVALVSGGVDLDSAVAKVHAMGRDELLACVSVD